MVPIQRYRQCGFDVVRFCSIPKEDIERGDMLKSRRYRNRRLGDFLKELDLTEGRSTGVPTIQPSRQRMVRLVQFLRRPMIA